MTTAKKTRTVADKSVDVIDAVEVRAWGRRVGAMAREPTKNCYVFSDDPAWVKTGIELAPIAMPCVAGTVCQARVPDTAVRPGPRSAGCLPGANEVGQCPRAAELWCRGEQGAPHDR